MQLISKQMNIQAELISAGGTDSEQCLTLKRRMELLEWLSLEGESKNQAEFRLDEFSGKALSAKHAYQAELRDLTV